MKKKLILAMLLLSLSLGGCAPKGTASINYESFTTSNKLLDTVSLTSDVIKLEPVDIPINNLYNSSGKITFKLGDLSGAKMDIKLLNADTEKELIKTNLTSYADCIFDNLTDGRWFLYCTKLVYADGSENSSLTTFSPYLLRDIILAKDTSKLPPATDSSGAVVVNDAIKTPILRYNPKENLVNQKSEIKNITSSTVSILPYEYSNDEISGIQYKLIEGSNINESIVLSPGDSKAFTFDKLQPNKTYSIGYRVLNADKTSADDKQIKGVWSEYAMTTVTTNASKSLTIAQGIYKADTNELAISIGAKTNETLPLYKIKVLPTTISSKDVLSSEQKVIIYNESGTNVTNTLTKSQNLTIKGLELGQVYTIYVTEVLGANGILVKSSPVAEADSDNAFVASVSVRVSNDVASFDQLAAYLINSKTETLPNDIASLSDDKIKSVLDIVGKTDITLAGKLYYNKFGVDTFITSNMAFDKTKYINIKGNIYISKTAPLKCVEYITYKTPVIERIYGVE